MFTYVSGGVVFSEQGVFCRTVSGYKCRHFLATKHSLLLGIFFKKPKKGVEVGLFVMLGGQLPVWGA